MKKIISSNNLYFSVFTTLVTGALVIVSMQEKGDFIVSLNAFSSPLLNVIFEYITMIGDGIFIISLAFICLLFYKLNTGISLLFSYLGSGLIAQVMKRTLEFPRPKGYLENFQELILNDGYYYATTLSFPSGHTTSVFAMMTFFALIIENKNLKIACLVIAILGGVSRMYLLQHFLMDVTAGAIIGTFFGILSYQLLSKLSSDKLNKPAIKLFSKRD